MFELLGLTEAARCQSKHVKDNHPLAPAAKSFSNPRVNKRDRHFLVVFRHIFI